MAHTPVRVAIVNDYEIVVAGLAGVLDRFAERVTVVEIDSRMPVVSDVDVVLYDTFGQVQGDAIDVGSVLERTRGAKLLVFSWNTDPSPVHKAMAAGAQGYIDKATDAEGLVAAIERVHAGEQVVPSTRDGEVFGRWPGDHDGLSARESEVLALICQGLSNDEIAQQIFLGINTVKTYIRTAYRKIEVSSRTQAVLWGIEHGFEPDRTRIVREDRPR